MVNAYLLKACLVGDKGIGEHSFSESLCINEYLSFAYDYRDDLDDKLRRVTGLLFADKKLLIQLWDRHNDNERSDAPPSYHAKSAFYANADVVILVCDVTVRASFDNLSHWVKELKSHIDANVGIFLVAVARKSDVVNELDLVTHDELSAFANSHHLLGARGEVGYIKAVGEKGVLLAAVGQNYFSRFLNPSPSHLDDVVESDSFARFSTFVCASTVDSSMQAGTLENLFTSIDQAEQALNEYRATRSGFVNAAIYAFSELFRKLNDQPAMAGIKLAACDDIDKALRGLMSFKEVRANHVEAFANANDRLSKLMLRIENSPLNILPFQRLTIA